MSIVPEDERVELARLRKRVAELEAETNGARIYWPGMTLKPEAEPYQAQYEAGYEVAVQRAAQLESARREARRLVEAASFAMPGPAEFPGTMADSLARPRPPERWLFEGLWGLKHNVSIEALYKAGKTTLLGSLLGSYADASPFLGCWPVHPPEGTTAAVWNTEMDADDFDDYVMPHVRDTARIAPAHLRSRPMPLLTSQAARDFTVRWLRWVGAGVWVIDSWTKLCAWNGVDPLDNAGVAKLAACLDEIKGEAGVGSLGVTAHMPHAAKLDRTQERAIGAQSFSGWVDVMIRLWKHEDGTRLMSAEGRRVKVEECQVIMQPDGTLRAFAGDRSQRDLATVSMAVITLLMNQPGLTSNKIEQELSSYGRNLVRQSVIELIRSCQIFVKDGPNRSKEHYIGHQI